MGKVIDSDSWGVPAIRFTTSYGDTYTLGLYREDYLYGGTGLGALILDGPDEDEYLEDWGFISVNVANDEVSREWCEQEGCIVIDTNNLSKDFVAAVRESGLVELSGGVCHSGFCTYPLAKVSDDVLHALRSRDETARVILEQKNPPLDKQADQVNEHVTAQPQTESRTERDER